MKSECYLGLRLAILSILLLLAILPGTVLADNEAHDIVSRILMEYGGTEAISRIRSIAARGTIIDYFSDTEGAYNRYFDRSGRLRIEVMPDRGGELRILNGSDAWQSGRDGIGRARPMARRSMMYQYTYLDLPMGFADRSVPVVYGGTERLGGHDVYLLKLTPANPPELRVYVDTKTFMILRVAANFNMGIMGESELSTEYGDFRPENGVQFPHLLANYAGDIKLSEIILPRILVNIFVPEVLYSPNPEAQR